MMKKYQCENCGKTIETDSEKVPDCCGKKMEELTLDVCTQPAHPEHARPMEDEEPCDEGRAG